jgi:hypothetical protein
MNGFLAYIMPVSGGPVDPGFGVPGWPSHPIAPGGPPPGIWPSPGHPAHPIAPGGQPPGIWGGAPPWVDTTPPGPQPSPGWPPVAMPPIYYPPGGGSPPGIWGPTDPRPTHPIVLPIPPGTKPPEPGDGLSPTHPIVLPPQNGGGGNQTLVGVYVPGVGGVWFLVETPVPPQPVPGPKPV